MKVGHTHHRKAKRLRAMLQVRVPTSASRGTKCARDQQRTSSIIFLYGPVSENLRHALRCAANLNPSAAVRGRETIAKRDEELEGQRQRRQRDDNGEGASDDRERLYGERRQMRAALQKRDT